MQRNAFFEPHTQNVVFHLMEVRYSKIYHPSIRKIVSLCDNIACRGAICDVTLYISYTEDRGEIIQQIPADYSL